jgi:uncharacterized membrane protein YhhN
VYVTLAAADVMLAAAGRRRARWATKPLLMPVLAAGCDRPTRRALALSATGDVALLGHGRATFAVGLASFLAAHAAWIAALRARASRRLLGRRPVLAAPYVVAFAGLNAVLWPRTGPHRLPVIVYSAALSAMSLVALDTGDPRAAAGGAVFLASDALLALERFAGVDLPGHEAWVMATYTSAQALLAAGGHRETGRDDDDGAGSRCEVSER